MSKFYVIKTEGKFKEGNIYDTVNDRINLTYLKSLEKRGFITTNEELINKIKNKQDELLNKYKSINGIKLKCNVKVKKENENLEIESIKLADLIEAIKRKIHSFYKNIEFEDTKYSNETIDLSFSDLDENYKSFYLMTKEHFEIKIDVLFCEEILKGSSKRIGLKSILVQDNSLLFISNGKNNNFIKEKKVIDNDINLVESFLNPGNYNISYIDDKNIKLQNNNITAIVTNPTKSKNSNQMIIRKDYLQKKDDIEKLIFGDNYNDNIHIQLAYKILDIKKILSIYSTEIVYSFANLARSDDKIYDFVGTLPYEKKYEEFGIGKYKYKKDQFLGYYEKIKKLLKYYSSAYSENYYVKNNKEEKKANDNLIEKHIKETYDILRILSMLRQVSTHDKYKEQLFTLNVDEDMADIINSRFDMVYEILIKDTIKNSKNNIYIACNMLGIDVNSYRDILEEYINFSIKKNYKNLGFDFKRLKEELLNKLKINVSNEQKTDTYQVINFILWLKLKDNDEIINKYVSLLVLNDKNSNKDKIYSAFADEIKNIFVGIITQKWVDYSKVDLKKDPNYNQFVIDEETIELFKEKNVDLFIKVIYFMTIFLDSKEINMLLTSLINNFKNISGFNKMLDGNVKFKDEYRFFYNSDKYSDALNIVMNIARMQKNFNKRLKGNSKNKSLTPSEEMIYDAYCIFGYNKQKEMFNEDTKNDKQSKSKSIAKFQNKITSTIINSNKFRYIIKYSNPKDCYKIMRNKKLVEFVLRDLPREQLEKYFDNRISNYDENINIMCNELLGLTIEKMRRDYYSSETSEDGMKWPKLYLNVIYQLVKHIVRINAYYNIAFSCLERDRSLFGFNDNTENIDLAMVDLFAGEYTEKKTFKYKNHNNYIEYSIEQPYKLYKKVIDEKQYEIAKGSVLGNKKYDWIRYDSEIFKKIFYEKENYIECFKYKGAYRDKIQHLNITSMLSEYIDDLCLNKNIRSYFEIYQYAVQKSFIKSYDEDKTKIKEYIDELNRSHTYSKKLLHILNMPFAYNVARYKNLTIEDIFYDKFKNSIKIIND